MRNIKTGECEYSPGELMLAGFCDVKVVLPPPNVLKISLTLSRFLLNV